LDIESRRLVEAANGMIKQDVRVLEKPRRQDKGERDPHETGPNRESKQHREHHQDPSSSAANRSDKMAEETWEPVSGLPHLAVCLLKATSSHIVHFVSHPISHMCQTKGIRSATYNMRA
jgi:hypothetical protein